MDLPAWLSSIGLGQYADAFVANDIDFEVLGHLDEADLERLGLSLGHRRKLIAAIAQRRAESSGERDAERRQVTVLFCDLVNSTPLANLLDPEDMAALIRRFKGTCTETIARYEGYVAQFMGDGALAYFGYPRANEDAAEQAVRAALELVEQISRIARPDGGTLQGRAGLATGTVMIGEVIGEGSASEVTVVGDTVHLAARLQGLAKPGSVVIANSTHQLLGKRFEYEELGEQRLKGFTEPVTAWRVAGETKADSRFAVTRVKASRFIGREAELSSLVESWKRARDGHGNAVVVSGDAGLGKSRLVEALLDHSERDARRVVKCQCSPYHVNSALHPVIRNIERAVGFGAAETDDERLDKLEAYLQDIAPSVESALPLLADLLGLRAERLGEMPLPAMQRKAATLHALTAIILGLAEREPVLLLLEDAHWADPTTRELWTRKIDRIGEARVLLVVTARPEFQSPWRDRQNASEIRLGALPDADCVKLAADLAAPYVLPPLVERDIVMKSDGIPLYVEELTKATREALSERVAVPATLQDSLMARLDRVGAAKSLALVASVIGQQFTRSLLAAVTQLPSSRLDPELERLAEAGLILAMKRVPEPAFTFRHALLRDIAYENLLRPRRRELHERVARAIAEGFPAMAEQEPEVLAYHYEEAGRFELASTWFERAGDRAAAKSSFTEAHAHFEAALGNVARFEDAPQRARRELALLLKAGPALALLRGPQHPSMRELYERARVLAEQAGDEDAHFKATWGLWYNANIGRQLDSARRHAEQLIKVAGELANEDLLLEAMHCTWATALFRGEVERALTVSEEGGRRYDPARHSWMGPIFGGHDPGVCAHAVHAGALAQLGRNEQALRSIEQSIALARELNHPNSVCHALLNATLVAQLAGDERALGERAQQMLDLTERYNLPPLRAHAKFMVTLLRTRRGEIDARTMFEEVSRTMITGPMYRYYAALLAEACVMAGECELASEVLAPALASVTEPGVGLCVSELYRVNALCIERRRAGDPQAREAMQTAIAVARQQGATLFAEKAMAGLAALGAPR